MALCPYPAQGGKRGARYGAEWRCDFVGNAAIKVIQRVTQDDDGFRVALDDQVAGKKQGVAVQPPVDHVQKGEEGSGDAGIVHHIPAAAAGAQARRSRVRREQKDKRHIQRVDQIGFALMRPEAAEQFRAVTRRAANDPAQDRLQQRQRHRRQNAAGQVLEYGGLF